MTTVTDNKDKIILHGATRNFTSADVVEITFAMCKAFDAEDWDEFNRVGKSLPLYPSLAKAIKKIYGKDELLARGHDLTEANLQFGERWLDEP